MITGNRFYLDRIYELSYIASRLCALGCERSACSVGADINMLFLEAAAESGSAWALADPTANALQAVCELSADLHKLRLCDVAGGFPLRDNKAAIRDIVLRLKEMVRILREFEGKYPNDVENASVLKLQEVMSAAPVFPGPGDDW